MLSVAPIRLRAPTGNKKAGNATALPAPWDSFGGRWTNLPNGSDLHQWLDYASEGRGCQGWGVESRQRRRATGTLGLV